jgi:hypothetical protein
VPAQSKPKRDGNNDKFCGTHQTGPELGKLMATGRMGKQFIAGDVREIKGNTLTVYGLNGQTQQVELPEKLLVCGGKKHHTGRH